MLFFIVPISRLDDALQDMPFSLPEMSIEDVKDGGIFAFCGGNYKLRQALKYVTLLKKAELAQKRKENQISRKEYLEVHLQCIVLFS